MTEMTKLEDNTLHLINRANEFINYWCAYKGGDAEIRETFGSEYLAANVVGQIARLQRLDFHTSYIDNTSKEFSKFLDKWRDELLIDAIKGAELDSVLPLFGSVVEALKFSIEVEESPELDHDLWS